MKRNEGNHESLETVTHIYTSNSTKLVDSLERELYFREKGITLISLVVTIIILLILAGITINLILAEGGLFERAEEASKAQKVAEEKEKLELAKMTVAATKEYQGYAPIHAYLEQIVKEGFISSTTNAVANEDGTEYKFKSANGFDVIIIVDENGNVEEIIVEGIGNTSNNNNNNNNNNDNDNTNYNGISRYLLVEVQGYIVGDGAAINEISIYDKNNEKIEYNILTNLEYDSVTNGKSYYWTDTNYWSYANLNDGEVYYTSNTQGGQNATLFLYQGGNDTWARFVIDLGNEIEIGQIRFCIGDVEGRTPKKVSVYNIDNFVDGTGENSTYLANVTQQDNNGLTKIAEKQFEDIVSQPMWFNFIEGHNVLGKVKSRYLLLEVQGHIAGDGAAINEMTMYDSYNDKISYNVLTDLEYDSVTGGKSYYWTNGNYWNYTNLSDGNVAYTSNAQGGQNATLFMYNGGNDTWARFVIDLGNEIEINQIRFCVGDTENRTPKKLSIYSINNFVDGTEGNTTYSVNVIQQNDNGLTKLGEKQFEKVESTTIWYEFLEEQNDTAKLRYLLVEVQGHLNSDGAVINEISAYDNYNETIYYNVLTNLEYDSVTGGKSYYWTNGNYWNYTNLSDGNVAYTSNTQGGQNATLFLYQGGNDTWARFVVNLGREIEVSKIKFSIGGPEGRVPQKVVLYSIDNFVDGTGENTTYSAKVSQQNNDGLTKLYEKQFEEVVSTPTWYNWEN